MRILSLLCLFSLFYSQASFAKKVVAEVVLVKGKVTKLNPGAHDAVAVKKGDSLQEDTSVVTGDKSIVRIKYKKDGSIITLGQKGKFVIEEVKSEEAGVVSLLVGKLRSKVKKEEEKKKNKLFIKTRTAAIGVRGTDFYTVYNPQNQVTSLVTFDGEVAMKKFVKKRGIVDSADAAKHIADSSGDVAQSLSKALETPDTVLVKKGRYSGVNSNFLKASKPVKISPKQYLALKENDSLLEGADAVKKEFSNEQIEKAAHEINKVKVADPADEGFYNEKTGDFAPKSGGLLDSATGIYVQPSKSAKFNEQLNVYEADAKIGKVDSAGNYIAPAGLALTATSGFVVADNSSNEKITVDKDKLNENIATAIPIKDKEEEIEKKIKTIAKQQVKKTKWIKNHSFSVALGRSSVLSEFDKPFTNMTLDKTSHDSSSGIAVDLTWRQLWTSKVDTILQMGFATYKFDETGSGNPTDGNSDLIRLGMHARFWYKSWMAFRVGLALEDIYMPDVFYDGTKNFLRLRAEMQKMIVPGLDFKLVNNRRFDLNLTLNLLLVAQPSGNKDGGDYNKNETNSQGGANIRLQGDFKVFGNKFISPYLDFRHLDFEYDSYSGSPQTVIYERRDIGIAFSFEI